VRPGRKLRSMNQKGLSTRAEPKAVYYT